MSQQVSLVEVHHRVVRMVRGVPALRDPDKVVNSRTLEEAPSARTRIERNFDPEAVRRLKGTAERDLVVGGPSLAAEAFRAGLVDECHVFLAPVLVGGGTRALPEGMHRSLELLDERRFPSGFAYLGYRGAG